MTVQSPEKQTRSSTFLPFFFLSLKSHLTTPGAVCWKNYVFPVVIKNSFTVKATRVGVVLLLRDNLVRPSWKKVTTGESISDQVCDFQQQMNLNSERTEFERG